MSRFQQLIDDDYDVDLERRRVRVENVGWTPRAASAPGGAEQVAATIPAAFTNCDATVDPKGDANAIGCTLKLYAITGSARTLVQSTTIAVATQAVLLSAAGRGCDGWELTVTPAVGVPAPAAWDVYLVSFEGATTDGSLLPVNNGAAGAASFDCGRASSRAVKAAAGNLITLFGTFVTNGGAGTRWLMIFDAAALPANGTAPKVTPIPMTGVDGIFSLALADASDPNSAPGLAMATGIVWAISSTESTLTVDNASTVDVTTKFL